MVTTSYLCPQSIKPLLLPVKMCELCSAFWAHHVGTMGYVRESSRCSVRSARVSAWDQSPKTMRTVSKQLAPTVNLYFGGNLSTTFCAQALMKGMQPFLKLKLQAATTCSCRVPPADNMYYDRLGMVASCRVHISEKINRWLIGFYVLCSHGKVCVKPHTARSSLH